MRILTILSFVLVFISGFLLGYEAAISSPSSHITIYAVAVDDTGKGYVVPIDAYIRPGFGKIFISVEPKSDTDLQSSAEVAVYVAQVLSGVPLGLRDILFEMRAPATIVGGPSAGVPLTMAAYALLTGKTPREDVLSTGVVYSDGSVGEVGGLLEKLHAAAEWGAKVFLIPKGQRYVTISKPITEREIPFPGVVVVRIYYKNEVVDLVKEGERLGVKVVEIEHVSDAIPYYFG